jgi:hypothetical protein
VEQLMTSSDTTNKIYFVSKAVHALLKVRESFGTHASRSRCNGTEFIALPPPIHPLLRCNGTEFNGTEFITVARALRREE